MSTKSTKGATTPPALTENIGTWEKVLANDDFAQSLVDFINVLTGWKTNFRENPHPFSYKEMIQNDFLLYHNVFKYLVKEGKRGMEITKGDLIMNKNDIFNVTKYIPDGLIAEACYSFSLFNMCVQLNSSKLNDDHHFIYTSLVESFREDSVPNLKYAIPTNQQYKNIFDTRRRMIQNNSSIISIRNIIHSFFRGSAEDSLGAREGTYKFIQSFNKFKEQRLLKESTFLFQAITDKQDRLNNSLLAVGNGGDTVGILAQQDWGIILFDYSFEFNGTSNNFLELKESNETAISLNGKQVIHFRGMGFDYNTLSDSDLTKIEVEASCDFDGNGMPTLVKLVFEGNKATNSGFRPVRGRFLNNGYETKEEDYPTKTENGVTIENYIEKEIDLGNDNRRIIKEPLPYAINTTFKRYGTNTTFAVFNRTTNDLRMTVPVHNINARLIANKGSAPDEVLLMLNIVNYNDIKINPINFNLTTLFESDKFEIKKDAFSSLPINQLNAFATLINLLKYGGYSFEVKSLRGEFVGKSVANASNTQAKVVADDNYLPKIGNSPESFDRQDDNPNLRNSFITITQNLLAKKFEIEIVSHVSPLASRFDKHIKDPNIHNDDALSFIEANCVIGGYLLDPPPTQEDPNPDPIFSYNQALATLRSMGALEAICYRIHLMADSTDVNRKLKTALQTATTFDKTVTESRKTTYNIPTADIGEYQFENEINYERFYDLKWYTPQENKNDYIGNLLLLLG